MVSVVIRNRNQDKALGFLLKNLRERYADDIAEIVVIDNLSTDKSEEVTASYKASFESIEKFSYGGSANFAAQKASCDIVVIFSAHSYPVSHDFFKLIKMAFEKNKNLAGVRCLHNSNDYKNYINKLSSKEDPNRAGLIFSGSAFNKRVWEKHPFNEEVATFEDKEWSKRVLEAGYDIELVPSIFNYEIKRTKEQLFFRFKNDVIGNYQLWHEDIAFLSASKGLVMNFYRAVKNMLIDMFYAIKRYTYVISFIFNKPEKFD
jgi:glycosyltransferase involved in cell wall biosynthesis